MNITMPIGRNITIQLGDSVAHVVPRIFELLERNGVVHPIDAVLLP